MTTRKTIFVICIIATVSSALIAGRTSHSLGFRSVPEPRISSGNQGLADSNRLVTNGSASQEAIEDPKAPSSKVPDYVVYGQLFNAVVVIKKQSESDERIGKNGAGLAIQSLLNLREFEATELEQTALAWDQEKESIVATAEEIVTNYRNQKSTAADGSVPPAAPYDQLQGLQEKLNTTILAARDTLRDRLGEKPFDDFQKAVEEHVTANIKTRPLDSNSPDLQGKGGPQTERPTLKAPGINAIGEMRIDRPRTNERNDAVSDAADGNHTPQKSGTLVKDTEQKLAPSVREQDPAFNFCFFGGIVFYGTFMWLAPQVDLVFQLSFTQLDICAGLIYDPYVYGELYVGNQFWTNADSFGRSFFRPAVILNSAFAFPSTLYTAYAEHWIAQCGALRPESPAPACFWTFIDAYYVQAFTPSCVSGGAPMSESPDFAICPGPSPSPTPTPTVKIDSVGFTGDYMIRHWDSTVASRVRFDSPDGSEPAWIRSATDKKFPAAYKRGTNPTMFATFVMTPAPATSRAVQIRVKKGTTIVATKSDNIGGGLAKVENITVNFSGLENAPVVKRGEYEFTWEVSFDNGTNWAPAGKSGKHSIYWTWDAPLPKPFKNQANVECFMIPGGQCEDNTLYDKALEHSAGKTGSEASTVLTTIIRKINTELDQSITYDPTVGDPPDHPLNIFSPDKGQCSAIANVFRGLLRSIGIDAHTNYWWGGQPGTGVPEIYNYVSSDQKVTMRVQRPASPEGTGGANVERDPHFKFHATVFAGSSAEAYDPSYGLHSDAAEVQLLEASKFPQSGFFGPSEAQGRRIASDNTLSGAHDTNTTCGHQPTIATLFPNPIDQAEVFVEQHYMDILNRGSDPTGFQTWVSMITQCNGEPNCVFQRRIDVSMGFIPGGEFLSRGYFVERWYKAAYGRFPLFETEYLAGWSTISSQVITSEDLELNKQIFADDFVSTDEFQAAYPFDMEYSTYVDTLFANAGITPAQAERDALISGLVNDTETRATVLRRVVDNQAYYDAEFNPAFVLSCYFAYLRRDPDTQGYNNWMAALPTHGYRHVVTGFIYSTEYRARFGQP